MKKMLIGFTGKAGSGKDQAFQHLYNDYGFVRTALADPLKLAVQHTFGLTDDETWGRDLKEVVIPRWGMSPRQLFQKFGNDALKPVFGDHVWTKRWAMGYELAKHTDHIAITDIRFEHEADMVRDLGGTLVHIIRPGVASVSEHISEHGVKFNLRDWAVVNDGTIEELNLKLDGVIRAMKAGAGCGA